MKKLLAILLLFVVVQPAVGQSDSINIKPAFKNQVDLEVEPLGVGFSYRKRINSSLFLSGSVGGGAKINFINDIYSSNVIAELFYSSTYFTYSLKKIQLMMGVKYAVLMHGDIEFADFYGVEMGAYIDIKYLLIGIKPFLGISQDKKGTDRNSHFIYGSSLISIKIPIIKW
ncbi:MAG: hypothetical protein CVT95_02130 [Bacteroidetes bacterium HGW-Bacteroidetes-12]|nr:MAG: hypothetical protein CVT95_02130 [Bacteroidetes bacterium HGW-Bacteroidetes-12]